MRRPHGAACCLLAACFALGAAAQDQADCPEDLGGHNVSLLQVGVALTPAMAQGQQAGMRGMDVKGPAGQTGGGAQGTQCLGAKTTVSAAGAAVLLIALPLLLARLSRVESAAEGHIHLIDNARLLAMLFVMFGHWRLPLRLCSALRISDQCWGWDAPIFVSYMQLHWVFAMPSFTVISGIVSQGRPSRKRIMALVVRIWLPATFYLLVLQPATHAMLINFQRARGEPVLAPWGTSPASALRWWWSRVHEPGIHWFLYNLLLWRALGYSAAELSSSSGVPLVACVGAAMVLFKALVHGWEMVVPDTLLVQGAGMAPLFAVALLAPLRKLLHVVPASPRVRALGVLLLAAWCLAGSAPWTEDAVIAFSRLPFRGEAFGEDRQPPPGCAWDARLFWTRGIFRCLALSCLVLSFLLAVCPREKHWFTDLGGHTIYVYLLHVPAQCVLTGLASLLPVPQALKTLAAGMPLPLFIGVAWLASAGAVLLLAVALASAPVRRLTAVFIQPDWFGDLLGGLEGAAEGRQALVAGGDGDRRRGKGAKAEVPMGAGGPVERS